MTIQPILLSVFSIDTYPDNFHSHIAGKEDKAVMMVYGLYDGDWMNVKAEVISPTGEIFAMESSDGPTPRIKQFVANVTGAMAGTYNISLTETLQAKSYSRITTHLIEYHSTYISYLSAADSLNHKSTTHRRVVKHLKSDINV